LTGAYDAARAFIDEIVHKAKTPDEKLNAYTHRIMCLTSETSEYGKALEIGFEILSKYGIDIPLCPTKIMMAKEQMKYKLALRNRSVSCLTTFPIKDDPLLALCQQLNTCATCKCIHSLFELHTFLSLYDFNHILLPLCADSGKLDVVKLLNWKIIQYSLKRGSISSNLVPIFARCAIVYARVNDSKKCNEFAVTARALFPRIRDDKKNYVQSMVVLCNAMSLLQPFRSLTGPFLQSYKDCKVSGSCTFL